jgi:hypothetical protein
MKKTAKKSARQVVIKYKVDTTGLKQMEKHLKEINKLAKELKENGVNVNITVDSKPVK